MLSKYSSRFAADQVLDAEAIQACIDAGEEAVAFEILSTQMYEFSFLPDQQDRQRIAELGAMLGVDPRH